MDNYDKNFLISWAIETLLYSSTPIRKEISDLLWEILTDLKEVKKWNQAN